MGSLNHVLPFSCFIGSITSSELSKAFIQHLFLSFFFLARYYALSVILLCSYAMFMYYYLNFMAKGTEFWKC